MVFLIKNDFALVQSFLFIVLNNGKLGIYLPTYGRVKACLNRVPTRKAAQTMSKTV